MKKFLIYIKSANSQWPFDDSCSILTDKELFHVEQIVRGQSNNHSYKSTKELTSCKNILH